MSSRGLIWAGRIAAITVFAVLHLMVLGAFIAADLSRTLSRGPNGGEAGPAYSESAEGQRIDAIIDILAWPLFKPVEIVGRYVSPEVRESRPWELAHGASLYVNSLAWGFGIWLLLRWLVVRLPMRMSLR
jgi:hypothetical protein